MLKVYVDACARPNPGKGSIGVVITGESWDYTISQALGDRVTNNQAEYKAVYHALWELAMNHLWDKEIIIHTDSEMIAEQLNGRKQVLSGSYVEDYQKVMNLLKSFTNLKVTWIPREENAEANMLAVKTLK